MRKAIFKKFSAPGHTVVGVLAVCVLGVTLLACDTTATFSIQEIQIFPDNPMRVVSVTPVTRSTEGTYSPACAPGDPIDGFRMDFVIQSTQHVGPLQGNNDTYVRAGDYVGGTYVTVGPGGAISADSFQFGSSNSLDQAAPFSGIGGNLPNATAKPNHLEFTPHNTSRTNPIAVAVLIDHSGSMNGNVDPFFKHETKIQVGVQLGTDPNRIRFSHGGAHLVGKLNKKDKLVAWTFSEDGVVLACTNPAIATMTSDTQKEQACFGTNHEWVYNPTNPAAYGAFDLHASASGDVDDPNGRTPLWEGINRAWVFLTTNAPELPKHIVVITDSPDTCTVESPWFIPDQECTSTAVSFQEFKAVVAAASPDAMIPVSFVQMQSIGYTYPDPAQIEVSCLTGGTYQWINRLDYGPDDDLKLALEAGYSNIRGTLGGVWNLFVDMSLASLPAGELLALSGTVKLEAPSLVVQSYTDDFRNLGIHDERLLLRQTCSTDSQCEGGVDGDCSMECISDGNMCAAPSEGPRITSDVCCCGDPVEPASPEQLGCNAFKSPCCIKNPGDTTLINSQCDLL